MADIRVTVGGDASGAVDALNDTANATGAATEKFRLLSQGVQAAASMALKFAQDSVKAYAESERVTKQLERATGALSAAFEKQASILSKKNAIDDDVIKKQQTMLAQWGAAPKDIEAATQAVLDYAAATGKDAVSATQELMTSVENGGGSLKKLGVQFDATGKRTVDLRLAVEALSAKFGGASEANADTLQGRVDGVSNAFGDLQKAFGGLTAHLESKMGVLDKVRWVLESIAGGITATLKAISDSSIFDSPFAVQQAAVGNAALAKYQQYVSGATAGWSNSSLGSKPVGGGSDVTNFGRRAMDSATGDIIASGKLGEDEGTYSMWERWEQEQAAAGKKAMDKLAADLSEHSDEAWAAVGKGESEASGLLGAVIGDMNKQQAEFDAAGQSIGAAFTSAFVGELQKLMEGGEQDIGSIFASIVATVLQVAGAVIGSFFGPGGTAVGGAIGGLAGSGVTALSKLGKKRHDGGWIGRFHDGGWPGVGVDEVPAVLQSGERVLSRGEVARAGGRRAVDSMVAGDGGGPRFVVNITAQDTKGVREFFEDQGGKGFYDALRTGRGMLGPVFGGG